MVFQYTNSAKFFLFLYGSFIDADYQMASNLGVI